MYFVTSHAYVVNNLKTLAVLVYPFTNIRLQYAYNSPLIYAWFYISFNQNPYKSTPYKQNRK